MLKRIHHHVISFKNAFRGLIHAFTTQPNFVIHFALSILAIILGFILQISYLEMIIIVTMIVLGLGAELMNTALEEVTNLVTKEWREEARIAKDVSAGMVLLIASGTLFVAALIFIPRIVTLLLQI